jgi:capsular exopolysaccharide synthesis family protein
MELLHYARLLRRRWVLLATSVLLSMIVAALVTARTSPQYAASVTLVVTAPEDGGNPVAAYQGFLLSKERARSYAMLIRSRGVTDDVAKALGVGLTGEELRARITAEAVPDTVLLRATVTDGSPALAMRIGNTLAARFADYVARLEQAAPASRPAVRITIADDADLPAAPVSPRPLLNLGLGLVIGLIFGAVAAVLRDLTDTTVKSVRSLRELTGGAALGVIDLDRRLGEHSFIVRNGGDSPQAEALRLLRTHLRFAGGGGGLPRSVVVTSAVAGEGKSTIACNLAVTLAENGWNVVLVDADPRHSRLGEYLGLKESAGLTSVLADGRPADEVFQRWGPGSLSVLASGPLTHNPSELLASGRMRTVLRELEERADIVLIDTPPLLSTTDAAILARQCTGALLVTRCGRTRREQVAQAIERLETVQAELLGAVLSFVPGDSGHSGHLRMPESLERLGLAAQR